MQQPTEEHAVTAVGSDSRAKEIAQSAGIPLAELAAVGGVAGQLLLEGRQAGIPVVALLVKTHKGLQDFESGLKLVQSIMRIVPNAKCDLNAIRAEAERTEGNLRRIMSHMQAPDVYR